jgi:glycosyltransferase involved in cell wall biosynthesis
MNKVLIITYYWPPGSGAGVQRWLKFTKYLPSMGWEPVILTVDPNYALYPATDNSLVNDIPSNIRIYKTPAVNYFNFYSKETSNVPSAGFASGDDNIFKNKLFRFVRGNFFIPDPRRGWNRYAFRKAIEIINGEKIKYVITTSPPHSSQLIGLKLKRELPDIKWIADIRDPWTDIYYYSRFYPTPISRLIDGNYEKQVLNSSDKIITVGKSLKQLFSEKIPGIDTKIEVITNGFDEDDFAGFAAVNPATFTISYIGTLSDAYPLDGLLSAMVAFRKARKDFRLRFIGTVSRHQRDLIILKAGIKPVEFVPHVDHASAIEYMADTSALLLVIPDHPSNKSIVTGKLFEYIASGKPVICIGPPDGDAAEIIAESKAGRTFSYFDHKSLENYLFSISRNLSENKRVYLKYSRKDLARQLINILNE